MAYNSGVGLVKVIQNKIQTCQNKILRGILNAPWYIRNDDVHRDLDMPTVKEEIKKTAILKHNAF